MPTFSTDFTPPAALTGLTLEAVLASSAIELSWDPSALDPADFNGYRVRRRIGSGDTEVIGELSTQSDVTFVDQTAPLNVTLVYSVTQSNLDFESAPAEASGELGSPMWWVVTPDDDELTFAIPHVRGVQLVSAKVAETYSPVGRPGKLVVQDVVQAEDGQLSFQVRPDQPGMMALLRRIQAHVDGDLLLKSPEGDVHRVSIGSISRAYTKLPGLQELTLPFTGV